MMQTATMLLTQTKKYRMMLLVTHLLTGVQYKIGRAQPVTDTLKSPGGKLPYVFVAVSWGQTILSMFSQDPQKTADERGYVLI